MQLGTVLKIISGGQTGADRAGLDFAIEAGIPHGGWCPKGRRAQDGFIPQKYQLQETADTGYVYRTKLNVRNSDATVIFTTTKPGRGSALTIQSCLDFGKPYLTLLLEQSTTGCAAAMLTWLQQTSPKTLNIAGSRNQAHYDHTLRVLRELYVELEHRTGETPKKFLRTVKAGIGEVVKNGDAACVDFTDALNNQVQVRCYDTEQLFINAANNGVVALTPGQAKRLANTLERWAVAGNLGG